MKVKKQSNVAPALLIALLASLLSYGADRLIGRMMPLSGTTALIVRFLLEAIFLGAFLCIYCKAMTKRTASLIAPIAVAVLASVLDIIVCHIIIACYIAFHFPLAYANYIAILLGVRFICCFAGALIALICTAPKPEEIEDTESEAASDSASVLPRSAYCGMAKHVLLLLFTFGIWNLIWVYRTTDALNAAPDEEQRNPTTKLLLYMFIPFYSIYWFYKSAQHIDKLAKIQGVSSDIASVCLITAIFIPFVTLILIQDKINAIVTAGKPIHTAAKTDATPGTAASQLKEFKELLDSGVITQEEFDAKKKQLLNL